MLFFGGNWVIICLNNCVPIYLTNGISINFTNPHKFHHISDIFSTRYMMDTRRTIYFPACGFGFWYLLGVYMRMERQHTAIHRKHIIRGSSAGTMICLVSCLKDEYRSFDWIMNVSQQIRDKYTRIGSLPNLRVIAGEFANHLIRAADPEKLEYCFDNQCLEIQISRITWCGLKPEIISPTSIEELMELVAISCTIPLISRNLNPCDPNDDFQLCCVRRKHDTASWCCAAAYVDGGFAEYCGAMAPADLVVPVMYRSIIVPSTEWCQQVWREGMACSPPTNTQMTRI